LPNTLLLTGSALALSLLIAVPVGVLAAVRRNSAFDYAATIGATLGHALPSVWIGLLFILIFSLQFKTWGLPWLPSSGTETVLGGGDLLDRLAHLVMPVLTLASVHIASWTLYVRAQMLDVLGQDFVQTARAKGLPEARVIVRHALRNALLPLITLVSLTVPTLFGGAVIIESIFSWPGVGSLAIQAATNRDYTVIMGTVLLVAVITVLSNLVADVLQAVADPRVQVAKAA
jgi:peptide/nickel transport system permease protein